MILHKDLQEILEGVHYFLAEALTRESLSGRAECLRRGLVLQLEALTGAYPTLRIHPTQPGGVGGAGGPKGGASSASLPYLPMDQPSRCLGTTTTSTTSTTTTTTAYSSSSSGVNSSSSSSGGSSGDGLVLGGRREGPAAPLSEEGGGGDPDEMYEEFDDCRDEGVELKPERGGGGGGGGEEGEEEEGVYTETHDAIPFSTLIATCERHGTLGKKTKGLLRNVKNYLCVAAGGMLYLYLKETDDRQKKSIDLTGYTARTAMGEDIKDTKKKDAGLELVCPGRKTHTFIARTSRDKQDWVDALTRTIKAGKTRSVSSFSHFHISTPTPPTQPVIPPKPTAAPAPVPQSPKAPPDEVEYELYNDVEEELYEEIEGDQGGVGGLSLPLPPSFLLPTTTTTSTPPAPPHQATTTTTTAYDPVDAETPLTPAPGPAPPRPPPPARPPFPAHFQDRPGDAQATQQPKTGDDEAELDDSQDIYCEIEDEVLESARQAYSDVPTSPGVSDKGVRVISNAPQGPFKPPISGFGLGSLGSFSKDVFRTLGEPKVSGGSAGPPRLPPKGLPPPETEDSEYKVPQNTDGEYHVPSSIPVPTEAAKSGLGSKISGPLTAPSIQVPQTQTILPIKPLERRTSIAEEKKPGVSSFRSGDSDARHPLRAGSGTSVRDMIARLNQRKAPEDSIETQDSKDDKDEEEDRSSPSRPPFSLPSQHLKPDKPPLPSRPPNLRGASPQPPPSQAQEGVEVKKEEEEEEEEELYDVLDGEEEEVPSPQQGEWYVAKFAFVATLGQALSFGRGDEVLVYDTSGSSGWWRATVKGKNGLVPREYLRKKD